MLFQTDKMYTVTEVSEILDGLVGVWMVRAAIKRGDLPALRAGRRKYLVRGEDAAKLLQPVEVGHAGA